MYRRIRGYFVDISQGSAGIKLRVADPLSEPQAADRCVSLTCANHPCHDIENAPEQLMHHALPSLKRPVGLSLLIWAA